MIQQFFHRFREIGLRVVPSSLAHPKDVLRQRQQALAAMQDLTEQLMDLDGADYRQALIHLFSQSGFQAAFEEELWRSKRVPMNEDALDQLQALTALRTYARQILADENNVFMPAVRTLLDQSGLQSVLTERDVRLGQLGEPVPLELPALDPTLFSEKKHKGLEPYLVPTPHARCIAFRQLLARFHPWLDAGSPDWAARLQQTEEELANATEPVHTFLIRLMTQDLQLFLRGAVLEVTDLRCLWTLLNELLIEESYWFTCEHDAPRILDCGSHFGLGLYYFKTLYPNSQITAFEPVPRNADLIRKNIERNQWQHIELVPCALSDRAETQTLYLVDIDSMAASLTDRRRQLGHGGEEIQIQTRLLSEYLQEPVDFLKMDIEGSEDRVLAESEHLLRQVRHLFIEYHHGLGLAADRLTRILSLLDRQGFDYQVTKSYSYTQNTHTRPFEAIGRQWSAVIWAKRRDTDPA